MSRVLRALAVAALATGMSAAAPCLPATASPAGPGICAQTTPAYIAAVPSAQAMLALTAAWTYSKGTGVTVAVVDSGVDTGNAHLEKAVVPGLDLVGTTDGTTDLAGLGTAIAGLVAAQSVKGSGLSGVAPSAQILPVRVYEQSTPQTGVAAPAAAATAQGITRAADQGARIIVVPTTFTSDPDNVLAAAVAHAHKAGSLVIAPVGDAANTSAQGEDATMWYPAAYSILPSPAVTGRPVGVLGVTAVDPSGQPSPSVVHNASVQLAAPGANVISTYYDLGDCQFTAEQPSSAFAAGYAAGVAALVASRYPNETPDRWAYRLLVTASRPNAGQRDNDVGWGLVNPTAALTFVNDGTALGPPNPQAQGPTPPDAPAPTPRPVTAPRFTRTDTLTMGTAAALAVVVALIAPLVARQRARPHPLPATRRTSRKEQS
ncbi:MAG: S8 family serine peptidase [Actinomycetia bacterium]|nr:S8 family serine peptidase [Actinomycetes bacterium]